MRVAAAGVPLEGRFGRGPAGAEAIGQLRRIGIAAHAGRHALRAGKDVGRAGEAVLRQIGGHQAGAGRVRGVQLLAVGGGAQEFPQAGRLGAGGSESVQHLRGVQPQQLAHRRGRGKRAGRAGGVEHLVVRAAQELAHADADFVAGHAGGQELRAAGARGLRHRERRRKHHRRRVEHRAVVHVVLFGHVRGGGVGDGGQVGAAGATLGDHLARTARTHMPRLRPHRLREARDAHHRPRAVAGHGRAEPVDQQVLGEADHGLRNRLEAQFGREAGQLFSRCAHLRLSRKKWLQPFCDRRRKL